jgi:tight adherence protein C
VLQAIGIFGSFAAVVIVAYVVLDQIEQKATVRSSLRQLDGYEVENLRDQELLNPLSERAILPAMRALTGLGRRFTPVGYIESTKRKLVTAGMPDADTLDKFLVIRVLTVVAIPLWGLLAFKLLPLTGKAPMAVFLLLAMLSAIGPDAVLNRRVAERQHRIQVKLPDILDLLTISVEAGLGFEQALDRTISAVPGPLSEEFGRMLGEVRAGSTRADAMRALDDRVDVAEVRSFVLAVLQADTFGVSIGRMLRSQADEARVKRRQLAQEQAQKAPVKMLIPMVFCIFPALFVVVIGPAAINITRNF